MLELLWNISPFAAMIILGAICMPLIERWDLGPLCQLVWWMICSFAVVAVLALVTGAAWPIWPFILMTWGMCACFGFGVMVRSFRGDMDDANNY